MAAAPIGAVARIRATPYARRLARERNLSLAAIPGSGPNGRITGKDLETSPPVVEAIGASFVSTAPPPVPTDCASAIVMSVEFGPLQTLLVQINALRAEVVREDICLKAAAAALAPASGVDAAVLVLAGPSRRQLLSGMAQASIGAIAAMRAGDAPAGQGGGLAVSFIGRAGVRPVAAQLVGGIPLRLVIGVPDRFGCADCLLSYDPSKITDEAAEDFLAAFRDLVEAPLRLLV